MTATVLALTPRHDVEQTLANLEQACALLREVRTIQDAKQIHDVAKAARVYASEHKLGIEVMRKARAVAYEALRRIGELLSQTNRAVGGQPYQRSTGSCLGPVATLAELGIDKKTSSRAQQLFALPMETFERIREGWTTLDKVLAEAKAKEIEANGLRGYAEFQRIMRQHAYENVYVGSFTELFNELGATGVRADAIITQPALKRNQLHLYSEFAAACADVPTVAVRLEPGCLHLPEVLRRLCEHLTYRQSISVKNRLILVFCRDNEDIERARARSAGGLQRNGWAEFCVDKFTDPGDLVVDPFMTPETALAATSQGRLFIGSSTDAAAVADARSKMEGAVWAG